MREREPMLFARIDVGLINRVLMPALEDHARALLGSTNALPCERVEVAHLLARMRAAMRQKLPGAHIRAPGDAQLANAAATARKIASEEVCHA